MSSAAMRRSWSRKASLWFLAGVRKGSLILSVSPLPEDHVSLQALLDGSKCRVLQAYSCKEASAFLRRAEVSVVICDCSLPDGDWKDLLGHARSLRNPPCLVVASRLADERLWWEVLSLGGYDVLAKPFHAEEVARVVGRACLYWEQAGC